MLISFCTTRLTLRKTFIAGSKEELEAHRVTGTQTINALHSETLPEVAVGSASQVNGIPHGPGPVCADGTDLESNDEEPSTSADIHRRGHLPRQTPDGYVCP